MTTVKPGRRTRSQDVQAVLVKAADAVLRRDGLGGFTVRSVATEAGVAPMGVYSRFGSKEGLIDAVLIAAVETLRTELAGREPDPIERLRRSARRYRAWALANPNHYKAIFLSRYSLQTPEAVASVDAVYEAGCANIEYAMARGALHTDDVSAVTRRFWCATHGAITFELHSLVVTGDAEKMFEAVLDMVIRGLAAVPDGTG